jgi:hypothetical protein
MDGRITAQEKKNYECRCGSKACRGTMLDIKPKRKQAKKAAKEAVNAK